MSSAGALRRFWFFAALGLTYWIYNKVPRAFIPEDDQLHHHRRAGAQGRRCSTRQISAARWKRRLHIPEIAGAFSLPGSPVCAAAPNRGVVFSSLKPFAERKGEEHSAGAVIQRLRAGSVRHSGRAGRSPSIRPQRGLGQFGGFSYQLEDLGRNSLQR
jgi:HAE1 family hydrophobic/amphiphilic exporter-1